MEVKHVVVDSGAFIRNAPIYEIGENIYTVTEVVTEVKDRATRQRLQVLPYELKFRQPSTEVLKIVTDFAKKTGDYRSLSAVDLKLIGLVYQLEKEYNGTEHLKTQPDSKDPSQSRSTSVSEDSTVSETVDHVRELKIEHTEETTVTAQTPGETNSDHVADSTESKSTNVITTREGETCEKRVQDGDTLLASSVQEGYSDSDNDSETDDDEDDGGWITPSNIASVKKSIGETRMERASVAVACLTTDFAMQNVLIQMGLNVVSVDGMLIKRAKSFVLRCHACFKITTNMRKEFCPNCGNMTLQKLTMTVDDDGSIRYCLSRRKPVSTRGLKYSLPTPKGGKHANNPTLCEDQKEAQQRVSNAARLKYDVMDPDYLAYNSPFAPNDVYSRSGHLGIKAKQRNRRTGNPNENRRVKGRRK